MLLFQALVADIEKLREHLSIGGTPFTFCGPRLSQRFTRILRYQYLETVILTVALFLQIPGSCLVDPGARHSASCTPYTIQTGRNSPTVSHCFCRAVFLFRHFIHFTDFFRYANDNGFLEGIPCTWTGFGRSSCAAFSCVVALSSSGSTRSVPTSAVTATFSGFHEVHGKQALYGFR